MHLLLNALSSTNLSGRQVVCGHLAELLRHAPPDHRFTLLLHPGNRDLVERLAHELGAEPPADRLRVVEAPARTRHWLGRAVYERFHLGHLARRLAVETCLSSSGAWTPGLPGPQYTLALNPWALVKAGPRTPSQRLKAALQRHAYRVAMRQAEGIGFGSAYMRDLYRKNAGRAERAGAIVYPALGVREIAALEELRAANLPREPATLLCVSLMTPHKDIATLLRAVELLRAEFRVTARLRLVGAWANPRYRDEMGALTDQLGLSGQVEFAGHLARAELRAAYRTATVFCLLSRCESFGIPAVEAQRMDTPVVAARCCAVPEVCGEGAAYVEPGDAHGAARCLHRLLTDPAAWQALSRAAGENARRFEYGRTSRPLFAMLGIPWKDALHGA